MTAWAFLLTPLLVLPIVLLFRFVGCASFSEAEAEPIPGGPSKPSYRDYIMGVAKNPGTVKNSKVIPNAADVIGYWRLVDAAGSKTAKDEKGFQDGLYKEVSSLALEPPTPSAAGSEAAAGTLVTGQKGLITADPATCRFFNGGYVIVPFKTGLHSQDFTIEAWVLRNGTSKDFEHTLFRAGGRYTAPLDPTPGFHLLSLVMDRDNRWQVRLGPSAVNAFSAPPLVPLNAKTHVALTLEKDPVSLQRTLTLYIDGKSAAIAKPGAYSPPVQAPLFIGISPKTADPGMDPANPPPLHYPVLSAIQEVVIHRKALSQDEIENHVDLNA